MAKNKRFYDHMAFELAEARTFEDFTQLELAEKLGYSSSQLISNVERAQCSFPLENIPKLAKILKTNPERFKDAWLRDQEATFNSITGMGTPIKGKRNAR